MADEKKEFYSGCESLKSSQGLIILVLAGYVIAYPGVAIANAHKPFPINRADISELHISYEYLQKAFSGWRRTAQP